VVNSFEVPQGSRRMQLFKSSPNLCPVTDSCGFHFKARRTAVLHAYDMFLTPKF